nr:unnamed protein product [Digitaria exilis]
MAASGESGGDPAAARRRWDLSNKGPESTPIVKEAVEMSTDEESDGVVICHSNDNTDGCDEAISSSHDDDSPEGQFYTKLEEKHKALEAEKDEAEARKKEEQEQALKQLRKSLVIKAKPMPSFYQEGPPPKAELKKVPPTRAKSPKFTSSRRKSCSDTPQTPEAKTTSASSTRSHRHSIGSSKDANRVQCSPKNGVATKTRAVKPELKAI